MCVINKFGLEIGGPSESAKLSVYPYAALIDNVIFSKNTVWHNTVNNEFKYYRYKSGKCFINDSTDIYSISDNSYDFLYASHTLEHVANPIKALKEWLRIIKNDGYIILVLPDKNKCFDHNREYSKFTTIRSQYENGVGEDDLSTLPEILEKHDLSMDPPAGTFEQFKLRSLDNYNNRCLHHYVYNEALLNEICTFLNCTAVYSENTNNGNIWFIMKKW
jgi:SAM-dependent methyltransferase